MVKKENEAWKCRCLHFLLSNTAGYYIVQQSGKLSFLLSNTTGYSSLVAPCQLVRKRSKQERMDFMGKKQWQW